MRNITLLALATLACSSPTTATPSPEALVGRYNLVTVDGKALPSAQFVRGSLQLNADATYAQDVVDSLAQPGLQAVRLSEIGTWNAQNGVIAFTPKFLSTSNVEVYDGQSITWHAFNHTLVYHR